MKWYQEIALWCHKHGRARMIQDRDHDDKPYIWRYYFLFSRYSWLANLGNVVLHNLKASDPADLHDHPWAYCSIIISGGYWEHTPKGVFWRKPGTIMFRRASSLHRLEMEPSQGAVWTLFVTGPRIRRWGFKTKRGWVKADQYYVERKAA